MKHLFTVTQEKEHRLIFLGGEAISPEPPDAEVAAENGAEAKAPDLKESPEAAAKATEDRTEQADKEMQKVYDDKNTSAFLAKGGEITANVFGKVKDFLGNTAANAQKLRAEYAKDSPEDKTLGSISTMTVEGARVTGGISKGAGEFAENQKIEAGNAENKINAVKKVIQANEKPAAGTTEKAPSDEKPRAERNEKLTREKVAQAVADDPELRALVQQLSAEKSTKGKLPQQETAKAHQRITEKLIAIGLPADQLESVRPKNTRDTGKFIDMAASLEPNKQAEKLAQEAGKETDEKGQTTGETLKEEMNGALREVKESKEANATIAAIIKLIGKMMEYLAAAFNGTLNKGPENTETKTEKAEEQKQKENPDARARIRKELMDREKKNPSLQPTEDMDKLRAEKTDELKKNSDVIKKSNEDIDNLKKQNTDLIGNRAKIETQIESLRGDSKNEAEINRLQIDVDRMNSQLETNRTAIDRFAKSRDNLIARNKILEEDIKAINAAKNDLDEALKELKPILEELVRILKEKLPKVTAETKMDPDGVEVSLTGLSPQEVEKIQPEVAETKADGRLVLRAMGRSILNAIKTELTRPEPETEKVKYIKDLPDNPPVIA